jgi:radical SAM superfamily enzyme YgiQ (UPF0313 family)
MMRAAPQQGFLGTEGGFTERGGIMQMLGEGYIDITIKRKGYVKMKKAIMIGASLDYAMELSIFDHTSSLSPPLGALSVCSYLARHHIPIELIDVKMDFGIGLTEEANVEITHRVANYLGEQAQEIAWIGISQLSSNANALALAQAIHAALGNIPIILGGYAATSNYLTILEENPFITAIVLGDGEYAALEISQAIEDGRSFLTEQTPNLVWVDASGLHKSPLRQVDLNTLPILDFALLKHPTCYPNIDIATSRGCPYRCNYCLEINMRPYSKYSSDWLDRQLAHIQTTLPNKRISVYDPIFGLNANHTTEICNALDKWDFSYCIESRVDVLSPEFIHRLAEVGVEVIYWGFESASANTLVRMNKVSSHSRATSYIEQSFKVFEACFRNGITPVIGYMFAYPGNSETDEMAALDYAKELRQLYDQTKTDTGFALFPSATSVYEGSEMARLIQREELPEPDVNDTTYGLMEEFSKLDEWSDVATERLLTYVVLPLKEFIEKSPEQIDESGVFNLREALVKNELMPNR